MSLLVYPTAADVGTIGRPKNDETLVAADATDRSEVKEAEEPISQRAVRVVEGFGKA